MTNVFDVGVVVDLAQRGDRDGLRALLVAEAARYQQISSHSDLIFTITQAHDLLDLTVWAGPFDNHPLLVLQDACPHPLVDSAGYCDGCDADTTNLEEN